MEAIFSSVADAISKIGGRIQEKSCEGFAGAYRPEFISGYVLAGEVNVPKNWMTFSEPFIDTVTGMIRKDRHGNDIYIKGLLVEQDGIATRMSLSMFQRNVFVYNKDGEAMKTPEGNNLRAKANGEVVDLYQQLCSANTDAGFAAFFNKIAGKKLSVTLNSVLTRNAATHEIVPTNIATVTFA